jgi:hypothetical protein
MEQFGQTIRQGHWKLIRGQGGGGHYPKEAEFTAPGASELPGQLYDLKEDVAESHNLYSQHPALVASLTNLLRKIQEDGRSRP